MERINRTERINSIYVAKELHQPGKNSLILSVIVETVEGSKFEIVKEKAENLKIGDTIKVLVN